MNQPTPLKEKKNISGRLSVTSTSLKHTCSSSELRRKGNSLTKKPIEIEEICSLRPRGKYLVGWGRVPSFREDTSKIEIINKDVVDFASGEDHLVFVNNRGQSFAIGKNQFGQLGKASNHNSELISPVFEEFSIEKVYCTHFSTFFLTDQHRLYACGLNNRGQLGTGSLSESEDTPQLIKIVTAEEPTKTTNKSRITSVYYNELKKSSLNELREEEKQIVLNPNESIQDIRGGPFHTLILTSQGRVLYAGNVYKTESLQQGETLSSFSPLTFKTKVRAIRSSLTGFGMLTIDNRLWLMGHFGLHIFDEPYLLSCPNVSSFDINSKGAYLVDSFGEVNYVNSESSNLKGHRLTSSERIREVFCGWDYLLAVGAQSRVFGLGDNSQNQLCSSKFRSTSDLTLLSINTKQERDVSFRCSNNFVLAVGSCPFSCEGETESSLKAKEVERENRVLKELLCNKNKKSVKIQTEKEGRFEFSRALKPRTFQNSIEIPFEELKLGKQISEGGYGIIYQATWRKSTVAVKLFKIQQGNDNSVRDFISECHAMQALRHPNIVMFLGACTKPPHFAIVLEYCEGGTLWSYLQKSREDIDWEERRRLALDVARGMNYLHERSTPILHRDLKSLNLLLDGSKRVKLADFGWTKSLENYMTGKIGTYQWMAPEVISAFQYTEKADVYSFGIILWEIASREAPYRNIPGPQVAQEVLANNLRPPIPRKTPEKIVQLMQRCWEKDPSLRPSFGDIIVRLEGMKLS